MKKEKIPILIGILLPVILVLAFMAYLFLPSIMPGTEYNFIYTVREDNYSYRIQNEENFTYNVVNNQIVYTGDQNNPTMKLYLYDTKNNTSRLISLSEANNFHIHPGPSSPDGFNVQYEWRGSYSLFYSSSSDRGYYIRKGNRSKKLTGFHWSHNNSSFKLIGWIKR